MENQENLEQAKRFSDDVKINVSRDGKWIIIRAPVMEEPIIKAVAYFVKILERATKNHYNAQQIKN